MNISPPSNVVSLTSSLVAGSSETNKSSSLATGASGGVSLSEKNIISDGGVQKDLQERRQASLHIVNRTVTMVYEKTSVRDKSPAAAYESVEPLTANKVANNILGFIERRLQMDVANGATQEQLQSRLEAGLSGFKKGFAEASEQLKALSLLSPEIEADINQTNDLVLKGIDGLRAKFITAVDQPKPSQSEPSQPVSAQPIVSPVVGDPVAEKPALPDQAAIPKTISTSTYSKPTLGLNLPDFFSGVNTNKPQDSHYTYASASSFSFELTTAEGDKVTIRAKSSDGMSAHPAKGAGADVDSSSDKSMSFSVEGDLNDNELKAINDLLGKVNDLAGQFYSGNLDEAFNQAVNLGYDDSQIGKYAFNLSQVEIQQVIAPPEEPVATTPEAISPPKDTASPLISLSDQLFPLGNFIKDLLDALDSASMFDDPKKLVSDVSKSMIGSGDEAGMQSLRFDKFLKQMMAIDVNKNADAPTADSSANNSTV